MVNQQKEKIDPEDGKTSWYRSPFVLASVSGLLLWSAFPPLNLWPLAWLAPLGWISLVRAEKMPGKHPYWGIYLASVLHWLLVVAWVRLPHWSAYAFGWPVLATYLACYLPPFVAISRVAIHQCKIPLVFAAPIVWTGLELARGHIVTGFSLALLGHTQVDWSRLIQIADLTGAYGVSFLVMFVCACLFQMLPQKSKKVSWWPLPLAALALGICLAYGANRLHGSPETQNSKRSAKIALIQGAIDTVFEPVNRTEEHHQHYLELTQKVSQEHSDLDLIIWPESMFSFPWIEYSSDATSPEKDFPDDQFRQSLEIQAEYFHYYVKRVVQSGDSEVSLLAGVGAYYFGVEEMKRYNSAILFDSSGDIRGRYDKMHPVMFGEYVPFGDRFPWIYHLTPMPGGLTPGQRPEAFEVAGVLFSPSICFENIVPHLIRRQILQLREQYKEPDVLVTITNDGWFWGSSLLDLHLTCGRFRAVENRKPMVIAANTGFSAVIDGSGRLQKKGPRRATGVSVAEVRPDWRHSWYLELGDVFAGMCLWISLIPAIFGIWSTWLRARLLVLCHS